jgi:hypothetical protein
LSQPGFLVYIAPVYVAATKEEIAAERSFQERLELSVLEALTNLTAEDLSRWDLRSRAFANLDTHIDRATSDEHPHLVRLFLLVTIYKCLNRLLEPAKAPTKRPLSAVETLYRQQQQAKRAVGRPRGPKVERRYAGEYARRLSRMTPEQQQAFKAREAARIRDRRARAKLVPGS